MITIPAIINEDGSVHLPEIELPTHYASYCDGVNYYLFENKQERDAFYDERGIPHD